MAQFDFIADCTRCSLREGANQVVVGSGRLDARMMAIGEAPGWNENAVGESFVGKSGIYLFDELFPATGLSRDMFYITNIVKCWPGRGNPDPPPESIRACGGHLYYQLEVIQPRLIVTIGRSALNYFIKGVTISEVHGQVLEWKGKAIFPLFHAAHVLRNPSLRPVMREDAIALSKIVKKSLGQPEESELFQLRR